MAQDTARSQPQRATTIDFPEVRHRSRKEEAFAQLKKHNVPEILEEVLNKACRVQPDDLFGYMVCWYAGLYCSKHYVKGGRGYISSIRGTKIL